VSFLTHGKWLPRSIPEYDWIFTTKKFHLGDLERMFAVRRASYLPHGFDDELHHPIQLSYEDRQRYGSDVVLVSTYTPKKWRYMEALVQALPSVNVRVYGGYWNKGAKSPVARCHAEHAVTGLEYTKAIAAAKLALGLMAERVGGSSGGDQTAMRSYEIPAIGTCMLHERNDEVLELFKDGEEMVTFDSPQELVEKARYYLANDRERARIAAGGHDRVRRDGHSYTNRVLEILQFHKRGTS
jgi:spore maturation protein CgeB